MTQVKVLLATNCLQESSNQIRIISTQRTDLATEQSDVWLMLPNVAIVPCRSLSNVVDQLVRVVFLYFEEKDFLLFKFFSIYYLVNNSNNII